LEFKVTEHGFMDQREAQLTERVQEAKLMLNSSWTGRHTRHAQDQYPHQWSWDAGFLAIGLACFKPERARNELRSLFDAQWANGMVPHIVFHAGEGLNYYPGPERWQTEGVAGLDSEVRTSGCIQPPIHAFATLTVYEHASGEEWAQEFLEWMYPRLMQWHRYLYRERDPDDEGLVYIRHPWEAGMDNSPVWDSSLDRIHVNEIEISPYRRQDIDDQRLLTQRPKNLEYDRYTYLMDVYKRAHYNERDIRRESPFIVQDPMFNGILNRSNRALEAIARILGQDETEARQWYDRTRSSVQEKLWNQEDRWFYAFDWKQDQQIRRKAINGLGPLFGGIPTEQQAGELNERLEEGEFGFTEDIPYGLTTYSVDGEDFDPENYWRGPVWGYTNWLAIKGLSEYRLYDMAYKTIGNQFIDLILESGFHEYWNPTNGNPLGVSPFQTNAALFLDRMYYRHGTLFFA